MFAWHFSLGGKADCVALLLQMFDSSPSVSRHLRTNVCLTCDMFHWLDQVNGMKELIY